MNVFRVLCNEPFCWTHEQAAAVTDAWFLEVIVKTAVKRHRRRARRPADSSPTLKRLPTREEYIRGGVLLGGNEEEMGRAYDVWAAKQKGIHDGSG